MSCLAVIPYAGARSAVPGMKSRYRAISPHTRHSPCIPGGNLAVRDPHSQSAHGSPETTGGSRACAELRVSARSGPAAASRGGPGAWRGRSGPGWYRRVRRASSPGRRRCPAWRRRWFPVPSVALVRRRRPLGASGTGQGRCGKTQLAAYLAGSLWQSRDVDLLAWVDATSRASVLSGYVQAAAKLGLDHEGDAEAVAARFLAWLAGTSGRGWWCSMTCAMRRTWTG